MKFPAISPFKLLKPYELSDAQLFFGRDQETRDLADALRQTKFILLYGASGTGKTSLIRCGLQGMFSPRDWMPVFVRRGTEGFPAAIRDAVTMRYNEYYQWANPGKSAPSTAHLSLRELLQALFNIAFIPVYLILDQFEEVFTLGTETEQADFFKQLSELRLFEEDLFCKLLISTREEYIAHFYKFEKQFPFLFEHRFRVEKMREEQLVEVVTKTLAAEYPQGVRFQTEAGVPLQMVRNLTDHRGEVDLTTLQVYLDRLYQEDLERPASTQRDYLLYDRSLVGDHKIDNVLSDFLDQQLQLVTGQLRTNHVDELRQPGNIPLQVLYSLVTDQGTKRGRTAAESHEVLNRKRYVSASLALVQDCFVALSSPECRILNPLASAKTGEKYYEITHDRLAEQVFRKISKEEVRYREALTTLANKQKLHTAALQNSRKPEFLSLGEIELVEQSLKTDQLEGDQKAFFEESKLFHVRRRQRERRITLGAVAAAVVFFAVAVYAVYQRSQAEKRRQAGELVAEALLIARTDATAAMDTIQRALSILPDNAAAMIAQADIYSDNEFYERTFVHPNPVKGVFMVPNVNGDVFSWTASTLFHWTREGALKDSFSLGNLNKVAFSPDGSLLAAGNDNGALIVANAAAFRQFTKYQIDPDSQMVRQVVFADNKSCFVATDNVVFKLDLPVGKTTQLLEASFSDEPPFESNAISALYFHPVKRTLFTGYKNGLAEEHNIRGKLLKSFKGHNDRVLAFATAPDGKTMTTGGRDAILALWDNNNQLQLRIPAHNRRINAIQWSPDSSRMLTVSNDYQIKSWSPQGEPIAVYRGHSSFVNDLSMSSDGQYFVSAGEDKVVRLWKTDSKVIRKFGPHPNGVTGIALAPSGETVYTVSDQGRFDSGETLNDVNMSFDELIERQFGLFPRDLTVWSVKDNTSHKLGTQAGGINALAISNEAHLIATASDDGTVALRQERSGDVVKILKGHTDKVLSVAFSPDGQTLASAGADSTLILWDKNGQQLKAIHQSSLVRIVAFAPSGQLIATGNFDGEICLFNQQGALQKTLFTKGNQRIEALAFSPDGRFLLTGEWNNVATLYDMRNFSVFASMQLLAENKTGGAAIHAVAFSPDSKRFCLGSEAGLVQVFRVFDKKVEPIQTLQHFPRRAILAVQFSPDGKTVLTGSNDHWGWWWKLE